MTAHKSMLETAVELLRRKRNPQKFNKIFKEVSETLGLTEEEKESSKSRFYSDLSLSALFVYTGNNEWDLKERQPIELWDKDASYFIDPEELKEMKAQRQKEKSKAKKEKAELKEAEDAKLQQQKDAAKLKESAQITIDKDNITSLVDKEEASDQVDKNKTNNPVDEEETSNPNEDMMDEKDYNKYMDDYEDLYEDEKN